MSQLAYQHAESTVPKAGEAGWDKAVRPRHCVTRAPHPHDPLHVTTHLLRLSRDMKSFRSPPLAIGAVRANEGVERAHGRTDVGRPAVQPISGAPPGELPLRIARMHAQIVFRAQGPRLP